MADSSQIRAIIRALDRLTETVVVKITLDVTANLIETTPVDTGWARANWVPALGQPFSTEQAGLELERLDREAFVGSQVAEQSAALAAVVGSYRLSVGSIFIANNVPYILDLNDGSSVQAPAAFVQRAIVKAVTQDIKGLVA